jgi:hypothetical protein
MGYGKQELLYARPFAEALVSSPEFRSWALSRTPFKECAGDAMLLHDEMLARRSVGTEYWWRSHYTKACLCSGCREQEIDLLAIFRSSAQCFALHVEVKHPRDRFKPNQAAALSHPGAVLGEVGAS